jgi:hypothetical protein
MDQLKPPYQLIRDKLCDGKVIPFLGSGASLGKREPNFVWSKDCVTCPPTAIELARHLAQKTEFPHDKPPDLPPDIEKKVLDHFAPDLAKVAQYYHIVGGRDPLEDELHSIFDRNYHLTSLHAYLADIPTPLLIVTTNYDDPIERAFDAKAKETKEERKFDVVIHTTDPDIGDCILWRKYGTEEPVAVMPNDLDINLQTTTVIYKIHGAVDRRNPEHDQYVITEDDYIDFLARMIKGAVIPTIFANPFQYRHFLFLGYGLRDWNMRVVWNRIEKGLNERNPKRKEKGKEIKSWAIQYKMSPLEQRFWQEHRVETYEMTIDDFVKELAAQSLSQDFSALEGGGPSSRVANGIGG